MAMRYEILNSLPVGSNTAATIAGDGEGLKNGMMLKGDNQKMYRLISVGMTAGIDPDEIGATTELLIEGICDAKMLLA